MKILFATLALLFIFVAALETTAEPICPDDFTNIELQDGECFTDTCIEQHFNVEVALHEND